jgi:tetratricopeptide (TPR) repeat protein
MKLSLAIYDEMLNERPSNLDLGRFYLRIGWVFRDLERGENPGVKFLKGLMLQIDQRYHTFKDQLDNTHEQLAAFSRHLLSHFETNELSTEIKSRMDPFRGKFESQVQALGVDLANTHDKIGALSALMDEYKSAALGNEIGTDGVTFGQHGSFAEFLMSLQRDWDGIVSNERESLEKAVHYYKEAFSGGRDISPGNQQIQASYLIAELSRRIGQFDEARQYFNSTIKYGQEFIYQNRKDPSRTALARKILELAIEQGKINMEALKSA